MSTTSTPVLAFSDLLESLRLQGLPIGVDHYARVHALLDRVADRCSPADLRTLLCPLIATSAEQQEQFYRAFDQHYALFVADKPVTASEPDEPLPNVTTAGWSAPVRRRRRGHRWALIAGGVLIVALALFGWYRVTRGRNHGPAAVVLVPDAPAPKPVAPVAPPTDLWSRIARLLADRTTRTALIALPFLAFAFVEWARFRRRRLALHRARSERPPLSWPVVVPSVRGPYADAPDLPATAQLLREREPGEARRLAMDATIKATIAALGYPTFRYRSDTRPPEYLVLIERAGFADHQADLADDLLSALAHEAVLITRFFYDGDPRVCFAEQDDEPVLLTELRRKYPSHRLIMFGTGDGMIDPVTGGAHGWLESVIDWRDRVLLTPVPVSRWDVRERVLARRFVVLPASINGFRAAVEYLRAPERTGSAPPSQSLVDDEPPQLEWNREGEGKGKTAAASVIPRLRSYLGHAAFDWLCACAIYPELHWDLTLFIGALPALGDGLVTEENVLRLIRLHWFRAGGIPDEMRLALLAELPPSTASAVREAIVGILEQSPPPDGSAAASRYHLNVAVQQLLTSVNDRRRRRELLRTLERLPRREIVRDQVFLHLLDERVRGGPIAMILPRRLRRTLYRHGVPTFGWKPAARISAAAMVAAVLVLIPGVRSPATSAGLPPRISSAPDTTPRAAPRTPPASRPEAPRAPSSVVVTSPTPEPQATSAASAPPLTPAQEIGAVIAVYFRALATRDIAAVRQAFPNMTATQDQSWREFFSNTTSFRASVAMDSLVVNDATAEAKFVGTYDYTPLSGAAQQQPVSFHANFRRERGAWQLVAVR